MITHLSEIIAKLGGKSLNDGRTESPVGVVIEGKAESPIEKDANLKNASFSIFIFIFYKSTVCLLSAKP